MKALFLPFLLLLPLLVRGQIYRIDLDTKKLTYSEVTEVYGTPREELFARARKWFDQQYAYAQDVTLTEHEEEGELVIQALLPLRLGVGSAGVVSYTLALSVKDEKYRYVITDFSFQHPDRQSCAFENPLLRPQMKIFAKTDEKMQLLIAGLHQKMIRKETASVEDW